jgi:rubrerythrin
VAIAPTSKSAAAPAALIESAQMSIVELRESDPELVALVRQAGDSEVAAGRKGKRAEYRCAACGYGIVVYGRPPGCPMCSEGRWEHVGWRPSAVREPVAT